MRYLAILVALFFAGSATAQTCPFSTIWPACTIKFDDDDRLQYTRSKQETYRIDTDIPTCDAAAEGTLVFATDGATTTDCTTGGGTEWVACSCDDSTTWVSVGGGGGGGSGDVESVGDCTDGACLDGTSDGGTTISLYDGDSHKATLAITDLAQDSVITIGGDLAAVTVPVLEDVGSQDFLGEIHFRGVKVVIHEVLNVKLLRGVPGGGAMALGDSGTNNFVFTSDGGLANIDGSYQLEEKSSDNFPAGNWSHLFVLDTSPSNSWRAYDEFRRLWKIQNNTVQIEWDASEWSTDGTGCLAPAETVVPSGGTSKLFVVACADSDTARAYGHTLMPDEWDALGVGFAISGVVLADITETQCDFDVTCQCVDSFQDYTDTFTAEDTTGIDATRMSITMSLNSQDRRRSADQACTDSFNNCLSCTQTSGNSDGICDADGVTPHEQQIVCAGSCNGGDSLRWKLEMDATDSDAGCDDFGFTSMRMEWGTSP